jgi:hypothetical protein
MWTVGDVGAAIRPDSERPPEAQRNESELFALDTVFAKISLDT